MKKMLVLVLLLVFLLSLSACGGTQTETGSPANADTSPEKAPVLTEAPAVTAAIKEEAYSLPETTIVDDENCTFIIEEIKETSYSVQLSVFCENKTDKLLMFSLDNVVVNGYMNDPFWATEVATGKKANQVIEFYTDGSAGLSIDKIDELRFNLMVYDSEDLEAPRLMDDSFSVYPTGLSADTFVPPERVPYDNETVISDDENGTFIICTANPDSDSGYTLTVFIENKTDSTMMVSWDDVSVNGYMVDPFWGCSVASHACAIAEINFWSSLEDNGIGEVEDIEFRLRMSDYDSMGDVVYLNDVFSYNP